MAYQVYKDGQIDAASNEFEYQAFLGQGWQPFPFPQRKHPEPIADEYREPFPLDAEACFTETLPGASPELPPFVAAAAPVKRGPGRPPKAK